MLSRKGKSAANNKNDYSRHWLSGKCSSPTPSLHAQNHINLKNNQQQQQQNLQHSQCNYFNNRPLAMQLENDMYYTNTVDFADSQQSPLIQ
jgi:hypothetical protein